MRASLDFRSARFLGIFEIFTNRRDFHKLSRFSQIFEKLHNFYFHPTARGVYKDRAHKDRPSYVSVGHKDRKSIFWWFLGLFRSVRVGYLGGEGQGRQPGWCLSPFKRAKT